MNRFDRVSAILIHLQTKQIVTAEEIARRFDVSTRTVYRDIRALEAAGVPIGAEPGRGFFLVDGFHLPPVMFTPEEARALLTAEKMVEKMTDQSVSKHAQSAMCKIKAVLPEKEKQYLHDLNSNIEIFYSLKSEFANNFLSDIEFALVHKHPLTIDYQSIYKNELTRNRTLEPVGLCFYSLGWHLIGYCRLRNDYRDFRVDRIVNLSVDKQAKTSTHHITVREYFERHATSENLHEVIIRFEKHVVAKLQYVKYYFGYIDETDVNGKVEMSFVTGDLEYLSRWLLSYADVMEIVSPDILKNQFSLLLDLIFQKNFHRC
jgi:predicted DNA-binding transcriptional regulator YafY